MAKITVLGLGGWGMGLALAAHFSGNSVSMWSPFVDEAEALKSTRKNDKLLKGIVLPEEIEITTDLSVANESNIAVIAVPSNAVRQTAKRLNEIGFNGIIVSASKGFEKGSLLRMSEIIASENQAADVVVLTGPTHAEEVSRRIPTSMVAVSKSKAAAVAVQEVFLSESLRIYIGDDIIGAEIGGAVKNIIAVCAGFCSGMGLGDNTKAALVTRGLSEMTRLGIAMGADQKTFSGLTGVGDLIVTCLSEHSRNNRFGKLIGEGVPVKEALEQVGTVEGYNAAANVHLLCEKYNIELPIMEQCYEVLYNGKQPVPVVKELMLRPAKSEN